MNANLIRKGATAAALAAVIIATGCSDKNAPGTSQTGPAATPDPRSKVIGVEPAPPAPVKEAPATTSPAPSTVSKDQESKSMPLPGQANDHSTLAKNPSQKAGTGK